MTTTASTLAASGTAEPSAPAGPDQRLRLAIRATPQQVWNALTDGSVTPAYYVGFTAEFDLTPGASYRYTAGGAEVISGTVLDVVPGSLLRTTFRGAWDPDVAQLPESTVTFTVSEPFMPMPGVTVLTCLHEGLPATPAAEGLEIGWVTILSGLKTLLETGTPMVAGPAPSA